MKFNPLCFFIVILTAFTFTAHAETNPPEKELQNFYLDWGLGLLTLPTGGYVEALDPDANLKFHPGFTTAFSSSYFFNDYIGINAMLQISLSETGKYRGLISIDSTQIDLGVGVALRYRISNDFEIFGDAGIAYSLGVLDYNPKIPTINSTTTQGTAAFYGDIGTRMFFNQYAYLVARIKYLAAGKANLPTYNSSDTKVDFSGLSVIIGVGFAF